MKRGQPERWTREELAEVKRQVKEGPDYLLLGTAYRLLDQLEAERRLVDAVADALVSIGSFLSNHKPPEPKKPRGRPRKQKGAEQ